MLFNKLGRDTDDMLTFPILNQVEGLKCVDDVRLIRIGRFAHHSHTISGSFLPGFWEAT